MYDRLETKLEHASVSYEEGSSCVQAILTAYREELDISDEESRHLLEEFSLGIGKNDRCCGVIAASSAILDFFSSDDRSGLSERDLGQVNPTIKNIFQKEYGGITCTEILKGQDPMSGCCKMKVKDMILLIEQLSEKQKQEM